MGKCNDFILTQARNISLLVTIISISAYGQPDASGSPLLSIYESRSRPFEEGTLFHSKDAQTVSEHQYLNSLAWAQGTLVYEGRTFSKVKFNYNIYEDILLLEGAKMEVDEVKSLLINQSKVDKFLMNGKEFINHKTLPKAPTPIGFYEHHFDGLIVDCYIKHHKAKYTNDDGVEYRVENQIYLLVKDEYVKFKSKKSIYNLIPEYKSDLKSFMKSNSFALSKKKLSDLPKILKFCDELLSDET